MSTPETRAAGSRPAPLPAWLESLRVLVATAFGLGRLRPAPGTWGTLGAALLAWAWISHGPANYLRPGLWLAVLLASLAGLWSAPAAIRRFCVLDPSQVVIDEVAGLWLAVALVPTTHLVAAPLWSIACAVIFFRLFDIAKPWPLTWLERLHGAWGILVDDLAAGLLAGMLTVAALH